MFAPRSRAFRPSPRPCGRPRQSDPRAPVPASLVTVTVTRRRAIGLGVGALAVAGSGVAWWKLLSVDDCSLAGGAAADEHRR